MKRKSKILIGSAIVFVALLVALFLARKQFVGGPGSSTVEGSRAVADGGIKIPGWNGRVDAAEERAGIPSMRLGLLERDRSFMSQPAPPPATGRPMRWRQGTSQSKRHSTSQNT
jgi:hypothetical protein